MSDLHAESYGVRGCKVRVYEPRSGANFMLARFVGGKYHTYCLGHRDPVRAKAEAAELIAAVLNGRKLVTEQSDPERLTLKALVAMYVESEQFEDLAPRQQKEKKALLEKIVAYFGATRRVAALDDDIVRGLLRARRKGTHGFGSAGRQSEYHCFAALRSVVLWAMEKRTPAGSRLLRDNPLAGMAKRLKIRPNKTPNQPVISHATYESLRRAARKLPPYMRVFLALAEGTGRRARALRGLKWEDVDLSAGRILWRSETDKMRLQMARPTTQRVIRYLRIWRKHCPSKQWVFPAPEDASQEVPKVTVDKWPKIIYEAAGLTKPKGLGWHGLRRKWASERRGYSVPDLMVSGGWNSAEALMRYLKTDEDTISTVIQKPTMRV